MSTVSAPTELARSLLARHPIAVDCARIAALLAGARADVVVFEENRGFVVASSDLGEVMRPRRLSAIETSVRAGDERFLVGDDETSVGFIGGDGSMAGAITMQSASADLSADVLHGLGRLVTSALIAGERSGDFFHDVVHGLRDTVIVLRPDLSIAWINDAVGSLLGRTPAEVIGHNAADFVHPDDFEKTIESISRISQGLQTERVTIRLSDASDKWIPVEVTGVDHSSSAGIGGLILSMRNADYESELGDTVQRVERVSKAIVSGLQDGLVATDEFGAVTVVNDVARSMFGIDESVPASALTLENFQLLDPDGHRRDLDIGTSQVESCVVSSRGEVSYVTTSRRNVADDDGQPVGNVVVFHDVTAQHLAREELRTQALHDQLTGLANRRQLDGRLLELARAQSDTVVAACFIDLDGFKLVNDNHGHRTGDRLIVTAAQRLQRQLRSSDLLVRHGGDEFVALLVGVESIDQALEVAQRCIEALGQPYKIGEERFDITASIGVAIADSSTAHDGVLLQHADIALYAAKNRGRNRIEQFDQKLAEAVNLEERQRQLLRDALDNDRVLMHFQPLVDVATTSVVGYEALARVRTTDGEIIGPASFMEAIANTGLIWDLDQAGFTMACEAAVLLARISPKSPPSMACNLSAASLTHPGFLTFVSVILQRTGVDPTQMCIEITESAAFDAGPAAIEVLEELSRRGFRLALDDFGTGYSSLAHLRDLPITSVKVDRSFIVKLAEHDSERAIAEAVVTLAQELNLGVVAEGVETQEHNDHAQQLGFGTVQGWHYSAALALTDCIANWSTQQQR